MVCTLSCRARGGARAWRRRWLLSATALGAALVPLVAGAGPSAAGTLVRDRPAALTVPSGASSLGALPASTPLSGEVSLSPRDPAALAAFAAAVTTPGSASYRRFLAPGQFGPRFGASSDTVDAVRRWLSGAGLDVTGVDPDRLFVRFSAPASAVASALGVSLARYRYQGSAGYGATGAPLVPAGLAGQVRAVLGLSNLARVHDHVLGGAGAVPPAPSATAPGAAPRISASCTFSSPQPYWTPQQLAQFYDLLPLYSQGRNGTGVTVALFELESYAPSDIATYESCYGGNATVVRKPVGIAAPSGPGPNPEAALDIEDVIGLAPQVTVDVYEGPDYNTNPPPSQAQIDAVYQQIADDDSAQVVSTSWGQCEAVLGPGELESQQTIFQQMAVQGQNVFAASGDNGSEDCYPDAYPPTSASEALWVDDPASQPDVTGVGGTLLSSLSSPEVTWNDCQGRAESTCAYPDTFQIGYLGGAGGGGQSALWAEPSWQVAAAGNTGVREVPDVSASASPYHGYPVYWNGSWQPVGGTSAAVVTWAAVAALLDQGCAGTVSPSGLYSAAGSGAFHDVTSGNNDFTSNNGGEYPAGHGYDMATGIGTPDAATLLGALEPGGNCPNGASGHPTVAVQGPGNSLWLYWETTAGQWVGPLGVGGPGSTMSAPAMAVGPSGLPTVAVQGPGNSLWLYWETPNATWVGPLGVGAPGSTMAAPAISVGPSGLPTVAVQGPGNSLWLYWETPQATWVGPLGVGAPGSTVSAPAIASSPADGLPTVAVRAPGNALWLYWETPQATWVGPLGVGTATSAPAITKGPTGLPTVAAQAPGNSLWLYWETPQATWVGPLGVGGPGSTASPPAIVASPADGLPTVAAQTPGGSLWLYWETQSATWVGPLGVGPPGSTVSSPAITSGPTGLPTVAGEAPDGSLSLYWETPSATWVGPYPLGSSGNAFSSPAVGAAH